MFIEREFQFFTLQRYSQELEKAQVTPDFRLVRRVGQEPLRIRTVAAR